MGNVALVLLSCSGTAGFPLPNGWTIYLTFDPCTSLGLSLPGLLSGIIDSGGTANTPTIPFPSLMAGITISAAALTLDLGMGEIAAVTSPIAFVTQ
jgi:hypothetical protein